MGALRRTIIGEGPHAADPLASPPPAMSGCTQ